MNNCLINLAHNAIPLTFIIRNQNSIIQMLGTIKFCCFIFLLIGLGLPQETYRKVIHNIDPEAKCLDGSSPALYVHSGSQPQNVLIYLIGGGSCLENTLDQSIEACYQRSRNLYGSSLLWPDYYSGSGLGVLELNPDNRFAEWTKIALLYCDGLTYQGYRKEPYDYKGNKLYFRGALNMRAHLKWINQEYSLQNSSKIVMMGASAGAIGVYTWIDYVRDMLDDPGKLYGVVDSGIFLNLETIAEYVRQSQQLSPFFASPSLKNSSQPGGMLKIQSIQSQLKIPPNVLKQFYNITNQNEYPPITRCLETLNDTKQYYKCLLAPKPLETLETKLLFVQSQYDTDVIRLFLPIQCVSQGNLQFTLSKCSSRELLLLDFYRGIVQTQVFDGLIKRGHSVWSNSCAWHVATMFSYMYYNPKFQSAIYGNKKTVKEAVEAYVFDNAAINSQDSFPWPSNIDCAF